MTINALACISNSPDQNKALRIRQLRAERRPKTPPQNSIKDLLRNEWPENEREVIRYADADVRPEGTTQWAFNVHKGPLVRRRNPIVWDQVAVTGETPKLKWGSREYNVQNRLITGCDYTDIAQEHGAYISMSGNTQVTGSTFLRCGSQGVQFAHRPMPYQQYDADCMPYEQQPNHLLNDSHFVDCGTGGTRPSFSATYFDPGSSEFPGRLRVTDCSFVAAWGEAGPKGNRSTGAFVVTPSQGGPPIVPEMGDMMESTVFENCLFDYTRGDRPIGIIRSSTNVLFDRCALIARDHSQPNIDVDSGGPDRLRGTKSKRITIRDCEARGVVLRLFDDYDNVIATVDMHCPGGEILVNGMTGEVRRIG